jgi:hypothetical protein
MLNTQNQQNQQSNELLNHKDKMDTIFLTINSLKDYKITDFCEKCGNYSMLLNNNCTSFQYIYCYCSIQNLVGTYVDKFNKYDAIFENHFNNNYRHLDLTSKHNCTKL